MNMKKIFSIAVAVLALAGCQKSLEYRDVLYFTGTEDDPAVSMYVDGPASKNLTVSSSKVYDEDVNIAVMVDPSALEAFNAANGTSYQMLPEGSYQLSDNHFTIYAGTSVSAPVAFSIVSMDDFEEGVLYCAPVRLLAAADGSNILYPSQTIFLVINSIITTRCVNLAGSNWYNMETMVNNSDLANLPAVTLEARVYMNGWSNLSHKIASVVGIEEHMIVRFGDVSCDRDQLQVAGRFNALNAMAALSAACELGADMEKAGKILSDFRGVHRRFEKTDEIDGVEIFHDYGHNPAEMRNALSVGRKRCRGRLIAVMQPHTFSRVRALFEDYLTCCEAADLVLVTDICAAREADPGDLNSGMLVEGMKKHGLNAVWTPSFDDAEAYLRAHWQSGDLVLTMGCGDINMLNSQIHRHEMESGRKQEAKS